MSPVMVTAISTPNSVTSITASNACVGFRGHDVRARWTMKISANARIAVWAVTPPNIFPSTNAAFPACAAVRVVTTSGSSVTVAKKIRPINSRVNPKRSANSSPITARRVPDIHTTTAATPNAARFIQTGHISIFANTEPSSRNSLSIAKFTINYTYTVPKNGYFARNYTNGVSFRGLVGGD